ncbi:hypothetical protein [Nitratireductor sp. GCM10026969]|uniref:hypothetical protein n=1 Tax=Nitratireductor sp. GCM10026969 TaxID=3252645 RepID=UPI0036229C64
MAELHHAEREPSVVVMLAYLMLGPLVWGLHLLVVYGAHTLVCALGGAPSVSTTILLAATAVAFVPLALAVLLQRRTGRLFGIGDETDDRRVYDAISRILCLLSLFGIAWSGIAMVALSSCAQGR